MKQQIMPKAPDGYRLATPEEYREILDCGMAVHKVNCEIRQYNAELDAAKLRLQKALAEAAVADQNLKTLHKRFGIEGKQGDLHSFGDTVFILTDRKKRLDAYPPPPRQIPAKTADVRKAYGDKTGRRPERGPSSPGNVVL